MQYHNTLCHFSPSVESSIAAAVATPAARPPSGSGSGSVSSSRELNAAATAACNQSRASARANRINCIHIHIRIRIRIRPSPQNTRHENCKSNFVTSVFFFVVLKWIYFFNFSKFLLTKICVFFILLLTIITITLVQPQINRENRI